MMLLGMDSLGRRSARAGHLHAAVSADTGRYPIPMPAFKWRVSRPTPWLEVPGRGRSGGHSLMFQAGSGNFHAMAGASHAERGVHGRERERGGSEPTADSGSKSHGRERVRGRGWRKRGQGIPGFDDGPGVDCPDLRPIHEWSRAPQAHPSDRGRILQGRPARATGPAWPSTRGFPERSRRERTPPTPPGVQPLHPPALQFQGSGCAGRAAPHPPKKLTPHADLHTRLGSPNPCRKNTGGVLSRTHLRRVGVRP